MMKSAESSAGTAPSTLLTHSGALSMMAGIALLRPVAPALLAHGPGHARADDRHHEGERGQQGQQAVHRRTGSTCPPAPSPSAATARRVSVSDPSGSITCSPTTPNSGK